MSGGNGSSNSGAVNMSLSPGMFSPFAVVDGSDGAATHAYAKPNAKTKEYMMADPYFQVRVPADKTCIAHSELVAPRSCRQRATAFSLAPSSCPARDTDPLRERHAWPVL